jgi:prepilin-type processing-associated H-X9-DG protein
VYGAFEKIAAAAKSDPLQIFEEALKHVSPTVEVKGKRIGGANYQIPMVVAGDFATRAWSWDRQGWSNLKAKETIDTGSYGESEWICNRPAEQYWRNRNTIKDPAAVPLFFDCAYVDAWPYATSPPPPFEGDMTGFNEWTLVCMNRHSGYVNYLFADLSLRKVGLKELWGFKWNRTFDIFNAWTKAGGVVSSDWPQWMRGFKDP